MTVVNIKSTARYAGVLYLLQIPLGVFGMMYLQSNIVVDNNINTTIANLITHEGVLRLSIVSQLVCAIVTYFTATMLSRVLYFAGKDLARMLVAMATILTPLMMLNELNSIAALLLAKGSAPIADTRQQLVILFLQLHTYGIQLSGIFFGLWLLPMGLLAIRSAYIPRTIGVLLLIACFGYLFDSFSYFLLPHVSFHIGQFTWPGELLMVIWLLVKGVDINKFTTHITSNANAG